MKIKLLIATADKDYSDYLSNVLTEKYADTFDVNVCSQVERCQRLLESSKFDVALMEADFADIGDLSSIHLPLVLIDESGVTANSSLKRIRKYQRISSIAGHVLEYFAETGNGINNYASNKAHITAVWSPSGGAGKTSVALAYAAKCSIGKKQTVYLNLENFSSTTAYFQDNGNSISKVFEKLDSNVHMFLMGIRQQDAASGIAYFNNPENYDDINILTPNDIETLINACAIGTDELVTDLSSQCDSRVQKAFELADTVLLVCDPSSTSHIKLRQFINQHNVFGQIQGKAVLVNNKGANLEEPAIGTSIQLPLVHSTDPVFVYRMLSGGKFEW